MENSFLPQGNQAGETTAVNAAVIDSSGVLTIKGPAVYITVGSEAGIYIRFGRAGTTAVSSTNGLHLEAGSTHILSVPENATSILHIREASTSSTISVQTGIAGT